MKIKQTLVTLGLILGISCGVGVGMFDFAHATSCGGVETSIINCSQGDGSNGIQDSGLWGILLLVINILTGCVGVAAVGGLIYSGILYASAGGSAEQTKKALNMIADIVIGIVIYVLMYSLLNYLVPGGLFN